MPFNNQNEKELVTYIENAMIEYDDAWKGLSAECSDFVHKLLVLDPKERMSSKQALHHPWIENNKAVFS